jgi:dGTPase
MNIEILTGLEIAIRDNKEMCIVATYNDLVKQVDCDKDAQTHRTVFRRDRDRILYSGGFRRLQDKTQVMAAVKTGDHRTRLTHSLEVEQIAVSIADALGLNRDLTSAIALGHDVGHTPFGHAVERFLDKKLKNQGGFSHALESVRYLKEKELSDEIMEGILKHDTDVFVYDYVENAQLELSELEEKYHINKPPGTLEAQIVYWADKIAYITHDYEDFKNNLLNKLIDNKDISKEEVDNKHIIKKELEEIFAKLLDNPKFELSEFHIRDLVRNITTNLINSSRININKCFKEEDSRQYNDDNKEEKQEYIRENTFRRIMEECNKNEEFKLLKDLNLDNKTDEEIRLKIPELNKFYEEIDDKEMIEEIKELKSYINEKIELEKEIEKMSNIKILTEQKKINRYKELSDVKKNIFEKRINKTKKEAYQSNLIINLNDDYRKSYLKLRQIIDDHYIGSSEVQLSDAKAENIVSALYDMYSKNIKILPNQIRKNIDDEIENLKNNSDKRCKTTEIEKIHSRNIASYISSMSDRYAEQIYMNLNSTGSHYDY